MTAMAISGVVALIALLHFVGVLLPVEGTIRRLITPGSQLLYSVTVTLRDETETFASVDELKAAYGKVKDELVTTKVDQTELTLLRHENDELRKQLSYVVSSTFHHLGAEVVADVVGRNIEPFGSTLIINRGTGDGVRVGQPVMAHRGVMVGKVIRAETDIAIVRLLTDGQSSVAATVLNKEKSLGIVVGGFGLSIRMNWIPGDEDVRVGDTIVTSGLEPGIPRGLIIGTVDVIEREPYQAFQRAVISPATEQNQLRMLLILTEMKQ